MAYIPEKHKKYNLLPTCTKRGGEVFSYPSTESEISEMLPEGESVIPYGYDSYEEFDEQLDAYIEKYGMTNGEINDLGNMLIRYKEVIHKMNIKENWSVLKYIGESTLGISGLTHGRYYYFPCSIESPIYEGIIDDEEFTSYISYTTDSRAWEIAEDPTGMAAKLLANKKL